MTGFKNIEILHLLKLNHSKPLEVISKLFCEMFDGYLIFRDDWYLTRYSNSLFHDWLWTLLELISYIFKASVIFVKFPKIILNLWFIWNVSQVLKIYNRICVNFDHWSSGTADIPKFFGGPMRYQNARKYRRFFFSFY